MLLEAKTAGGRSVPSRPVRPRRRAEHGVPGRFLPEPTALPLALNAASPIR
jgi:hypothetical protein